MKRPCILLVALTWFVGVTNAVEPVQGQRVFTCGHSFHLFVPTILRELAQGAGVNDHVQVGVSPIGGSRVIQHWNVPDDKFKSKEALTAGKVDVLTLSPIFLPDDGIENFVKLALEHNPRTRIALQQSWMPWDQSSMEFPWKNRPKQVDRDSKTVDELRQLHAAYFKSYEDHVRSLNEKYKTHAVCIVPVGQAVIALRAKIIEGKVPGIKTQGELFTDAIGHIRAPVMALNAYCHYAVIYRKSPVGLAAPKVLGKGNEEVASLNRMLQELAWDAVRHHPLSGVKAD